MELLKKIVSPVSTLLSSFKNEVREPVAKIPDPKKGLNNFGCLLELEARRRRNALAEQKLNNK